MNVSISKAYSQASNVEKDNIEIRPATPFAPESTVDSEIIEKKEEDFNAVICKYRTSAVNSKKTKYDYNQRFGIPNPTEISLCGLNACTMFAT